MFDLLNKFQRTTLLAALSVTVISCGSGGSSAIQDLQNDITDGLDQLTSSSSSSSSASSSASSSSSSSASSSTGSVAAIDMRDLILDERSGDCADHTNSYIASVNDLTRGMGFDESVEITSDSSTCTLTSNNIPNHDFNDNSASFATNVAEVNQTFTVPRNPSLAPGTTQLTQSRYDGVMLNGVPLDILSAGCYDPNGQMADQDGNVPIGCDYTDAWLVDPLGTETRFGADMHNAHTQPDGSYHYHGNPNALFDDNPGPNGSPVIGFAADGFPIYGSYFLDSETGTVRKALSGYTLKSGSRPGPDDNDPGGTYDGTYNDDWEFTDAGDLDACNGMSVNGQYGYYVTDTFPWVIRCLSGTPDDSFERAGGGGPPP